MYLSINNPSSAIVVVVVAAAVAGNRHRAFFFSAAASVRKKLFLADRSWQSDGPGLRVALLEGWTAPPRALGGPRGTAGLGASVRGGCRCASGPRGDEKHFVHRFEEYTREQEEQEILGDGWSNYVVGYRSSTAADFNPGKPETATDDVDKSKVGLKIPIAPQGRISWIEDRKKARTLAREGSFYLAKQQYQYILRKYNSLRSRSVHDMHIELGQLLVIIGEPEEALRSFREALSFQPESHIAHYHLGMLATRVGSFADAVQHYKNALFYDSKHCQTLHNLGSLLFFSLQFEEAEYYFF